MVDKKRTADSQDQIKASKQEIQSLKDSNTANFQQW